MVKKIILLVLYFLQFYIYSLSGDFFLSNLTNCQEQEPQVFGPWSREKTKQEKKPLGKKLGAGAAWRKNQEPEPQKKYQAPRP